MHAHLLGDMRNSRGFGHCGTVHILLLVVGDGEEGRVPFRVRPDGHDHAQVPSHRAQASGHSAEAGGRGCHDDGEGEAEGCRLRWWKPKTATTVIEPVSIAPVAAAMQEVGNEKEKSVSSQSSSVTP
jgi:hypothetical protein